MMMTSVCVCGCNNEGNAHTWKTLVSMHLEREMERNGGSILIHKEKDEDSHNFSIRHHWHV